MGLCLAWLTLKEPVFNFAVGVGVCLVWKLSQKHPNWFDQILSKCCVEPWQSRKLTIMDKEIIHTQKHC